MKKIPCEYRTDEGYRLFKDNVCGTIRTIECGGGKRVIEIYDKSENILIKQATETGVRKIDKITNKENHIIDSAVVDKTQYRIRKLTPKECWRLMGFSDDAFEKAKNAGISNTQLYKQAGNSIVTHVLYHIYVELYKAMPYLFDDLKVGSYFSGIGAFETALDMLYENENANNFYIPEINFQDSQT